MIQKTRPANGAAASLQSNAKSTRWQISAAAAAVATLMGLWAPDASALALGRVKVLSTLGEPLRAEIDIPQITPAEAESLRVNPGSAELFRAAGLEYNPSVSNVRVSIQHRADGRPFLRLSSNRPVNDPFMDLIVEATWASGRIARDYTMLFDPQGGRVSAPSAVAASPQVSAPQVSAASPVRAPAPVVAQSQVPINAPVTASGGGATTTRAERMRAARAAAAAAAVAPSDAARAAATPSRPAQVTVRPGDTAGRIAAAHAPANVSLEQMLVAMLRANPSAFVDGNINLIRAGAVIELPGAAEATVVTPAQARQTVIAQSQDFNSFRRKLATAAAPAQVATAERSARGKLQAEVDERKPATAAPDRLTLSKGAIDSRTAGAVVSEDTFAKTNEARDAAARTAELQKNINELNKLGAASATTTTGAAGATTPGAAAVAAAALPTSSPAGATGSGASSSNASAAAAPMAAAAALAEKPVTAAKAPAETGIVEQMLGEPLIPALGLGLVALLAGFGFHRSRKRKFEAEEAAFLAESSAAPESFFGASGGQKVDTIDDATHGSSVAYSPSQLDAGGEVDPVAEADVYLAYGRDQQAVDTLTEALRAHPDRLATRTKLLEIHARRQDAKAFETVASQTLPLIGNDSPEWQRISELGRELDFSNPLYQPSGFLAPQSKAETGDLLAAAPTEFSARFDASSSIAALGAASAAAGALHRAPAPAAWKPPFDLDLDLGAAAPPARPAAPRRPFAAPRRPFSPPPGGPRRCYTARTA